MTGVRLSRFALLTLLTDVFFLWIIVQYALGGWQLGWFLLTVVGLPAWIALLIVAGLVLYRSNYRTDLPLFLAGYALGYWGEWWGTTRGVWTYASGQTPPDYLPPLWALGLLTVYHLRLLLGTLLPRSLNIHEHIKVASFFVLPVTAFLLSAPRLMAVDWSGRLDSHFYLGIAVGLSLLFFNPDVDEAFGLYLCGMLLGGTYEWLGTSIGEWTYVTHEVPPLWIVPLWGLACVAMVKLASLFSSLVSRVLSRGFST